MSWTITSPGYLPIRGPAWTSPAGEAVLSATREMGLPLDGPRGESGEVYRPTSCHSFLPQLLIHCRAALLSSPGESRFWRIPGQGGPAVRLKVAVENCDTNQSINGDYAITRQLRWQ